MLRSISLTASYGLIDRAWMTIGMVASFVVLVAGYHLYGVLSERRL